VNSGKEVEEMSKGREARRIWGFITAILAIAMILGAGVARSAELPFYAATQIKPNVLILLDTSGSMDWYPDRTRDAPRGQRRIDIAQRVLTGSGKTPILYDNQYYTYLGVSNGERKLYDDLFDKGVLVEILILEETSPNVYQIVPIDYYLQNKDTKQFYFTFKDWIDVQFPSDLTDEVYPLSKFMIDYGIENAVYVHSAIDIEGDAPNSQLPNFIGIHRRPVLKLSPTGDQTFKNLVLTYYGAQDNFYIIRVRYEQYCYQRWGRWYSCYKPAPFPSTGNPKDDPYWKVTTFLIPDDTDFRYYNNGQLGPDYLDSANTMIGFVQYLQNAGVVDSDYNSYAYKESRRVCGDGPWWWWGCPNDGRYERRDIYNVVQDGTANAVKVGGNWTEQEIINNIVGIIPYVDEVDVWGPNEEPDGNVGPEFTEIPGSGSERKDVAIRKGLDWSSGTTLYQPYERTLCIDDPYFCDFFGYYDSANDVHVFTGLPYTQLAKEQPGIMDTYDVRYGFMIFDNHNSDSDFPAMGGNLVWNLCEGSTNNAYLQEVIAVRDENGDGVIGDGSVPQSVLNILDDPSGGTPIAGMLRDAFTYLYNHYFDPSEIDDPEYVPYYPPYSHDTNPSMYNHWDPDRWDMQDFNGHILLNDPYYYYQCRRNNIIFVTDGGQTEGEPCMGDRDCYYEVRDTQTLNQVSAVQTKYIRYFVDPSSVIGTYEQGDWLPTKVYLIGFALQTASGADTFAMQMLENMADASDIPNEIGDLTDPLYANSEQDLIAALNWIMSKIMEGSYTLSPPVLSPNYDYGIAGYFEVVAEDYLWRGHLKLAEAPPDLEEQEGSSITVESTYDAGEVLNTRDPNTRQIFTSIYNDSDNKWEKVDFASNNASVLYDYLFANEQVDQDLDGDVDTTDASILIDFIRGDKNATYLDADETPRTWRLGAIYHSKPRIVIPPIPYAFPNDDTYQAFAQQYSDLPMIAYVGALDGMLHAFFVEDPDGDGERLPMEEAFAYIPNQLLSKLYLLRQGQQEIFVDGDPVVAAMRTHMDNVPDVAWCDMDEGWCWRILLFSGLRDGGPVYLSLDVTDASTVFGQAGDDVTVRWEFTDPDVPSDPFDSILGNSWSTPRLAEVNYQPEGEEFGTRAVMVFGGGKDPNGFSGTPNMGSWLYFVDLDTGETVKVIPVPSIKQKCDIGPGELVTPETYESCDKKDKNMNQVPGDVFLVDIDNDGSPDWGYFGDFEGRVWKINIHDPDPENWGICLFFDTGDKGYDNIPPSPPGYISASCDGDLNEYGKRQPNCVNPDKRRPILYRPEFTMAPHGEGYIVYVGTGHVEDKLEALDQTRRNYVFALLDRDAINECTYADIWVGRTGEDSGWPIELEPGEKLISAPRIYKGVVYFLTYNPYDITNPCAPGTTYKWGVNYATGEGALATSSGMVRRIPQEGFVSMNIIGNVLVQFDVTTGEFKFEPQPKESFRGFYYWWVR